MARQRRHFTQEQKDEIVRMVLDGPRPVAHVAREVGIHDTVHAGRVHHDAYGVHGRDVTHMFRLLTASAFKNAVRDADADLGMIVSDRLYRDATAASVLINSAAYRELDISSKETLTTAHLWLPPGSTPPSST